METAPSWIQHFDIVQAFIAVMLSVIAWYFIDHANSVKDALTDLKNEIKEDRALYGLKISTLEQEVFSIKGAHSANHPNQL